MTLKQRKIRGFLGVTRPTTAHREPEMDRKWQMTLKQQLTALDALTSEQKRLVTLVYMRDGVTLEEAIALVKGGKR